MLRLIPYVSLATFPSYMGFRQYKLFKGATGLYKPVGGAGAYFCIISNMLHTRDLFFKIKEYLQII